MQDAKSANKAKPANKTKAATKKEHTMIISPNMKELTQVMINPQSSEWNRFLTLSVDYLCENWSEVLENGETKETFIQTYEQQLLHRIEEGGRILLVWKLGDVPIGFANAWLEEVKHKEIEQAKVEGNVHTNGDREARTLLIAEFSILKNYRRKGLGHQCFQQLVAIGQQNKATRIVAEVDTGIAANLFWRKVMTYSIIDATKRRNLYWRNC